MIIGLLNILDKPNVNIPQWEYVGTPAEIVQKGQRNLITCERMYMPDITKKSKNQATTVLGFFEFYGLDVYKSHVYKYRGTKIKKAFNPETLDLPEFTISLEDYSDGDLDYLYDKKLLSLQSRKKKWFQTNEYGNYILKNNKRLFITENIMLREGIFFLLKASNGFMVKNTSEILWWLYFKNKDFSNKDNPNLSIKEFSNLASKHPVWIINDDYYKNLINK
jgi:hypothetical protein